MWSLSKTFCAVFLEGTPLHIQLAKTWSLPGLSQQELEKLIDEAPQSVFFHRGFPAVMSVGRGKKYAASFVQLFHKKITETSIPRFFTNGWVWLRLDEPKLGILPMKLSWKLKRWWARVAKHLISRRHCADLSFLCWVFFTLPETNIAPENGWLEYSFPFGMVYFQVLCEFQGVYFSGKGGSWEGLFWEKLIFFLEGVQGDTVSFKKTWHFLKGFFPQ